jgi:hypothetical protein
MEIKDFIFDKIKAIDGVPEGRLLFKNNNVYFDHLNLTWLGKDTLRGYGVSVSLAAKFNSCYGKLGEDARKAADKVISLSPDDILVLFKVSVRISTQEISEHIGKMVFDPLPDEVKTVLVSLWRQFGSLNRLEYPALAMASRMLVHGRLQAAIRYLEDKKGWGTEGKVSPRRSKEIAILNTFLKKEN